MKIYLDTIGCRLNQSEIETYARGFRTAGHELVASPENADLAVINTCTVTAAAAADSRKKIRGMERAGAPKVIVTGCWSTLEPQKAAALSGVNRIIPNSEKDGLVSKVLGIPPEELHIELTPRQPVPGTRSRTRAFIKVQDGCDNRCTFCITTLARGPGRSRPVPAILSDIHAALDGGTQEIVLTGVHLGSWGYDLPNNQALRDLVAAILKETDTPRLRLSSLEPWDIEVDFFDLWQDQRLARHLHLPLQSGCRETLKRMARKTTPAAYAQLLETARKSIPGLSITTDIIVGFPGETSSEFDQSLEFVSKMAFSRGHVFTYSERPGTAAARMPNAIPYPIRKSRNAKMRAEFERQGALFQNQFIGKELWVLWESAQPIHKDSWKLKGLSDNYLHVFLSGSPPFLNQIERVRITGTSGEGLSAERISQ